MKTKWNIIDKNNYLALQASTYLLWSNSRLQNYILGRRSLASHIFTRITSQLAGNFSSIGWWDRDSEFCRHIWHIDVVFSLHYFKAAHRECLFSGKRQKRFSSCSLWTSLGEIFSVDVGHIYERKDKRASGMLTHDQFVVFRFSGWVLWMQSSS